MAHKKELDNLIELFGVLSAVLFLIRALWVRDGKNSKAFIV